MLIGVAIHGVARSGGNIAWSLWTTKFAKADNVADYMAVHSFCTGVRGIMAPFIALPIASAFSLATVGWLSAGLMTIATLMILPDVNNARRTKRN